MASQEVLSALETLHKELEKLEPAIRHVEAAQEVTAIVRGIPQKHLELIDNLRTSDIEHKSDLKHIFVQELAEIANENRSLQQTTASIQEQVKLEQEALSQLKQTVQLFHDRVEKINFPERLDNIYMKLGGILTTIESSQRALQESEAATRSLVHQASKKQQIFSFITWTLLLAAVALFVLLKK
jgi:chromosome segregation ATPase